MINADMNTTKTKARLDKLLSLYETVEILIHSPKGGVGKTLLCCLLSELLLYLGYTVQIKDSDDNQSMKEWIDNNESLGRKVNTLRKPNFRITDTKGVRGSASAFIKKTHLIVCPFEPGGFDLSEVLDFFIDLGDEDCRKSVLYFSKIDSLGLVKEEAEVAGQVMHLCHAKNVKMLQVEKLDSVVKQVVPIIDELGETREVTVEEGTKEAKQKEVKITQLQRSLVSVVAPAIVGRITFRRAVYKPIYNGSTKNFFELSGTKSLINAQRESFLVLDELTEFMSETLVKNTK